MESFQNILKKLNLKLIYWKCQIMQIWPFLLTKQNLIKKLHVDWKYFPLCRIRKDCETIQRRKLIEFPLSSLLCFLGNRKIPPQTVPTRFKFKFSEYWQHVPHRASAFCKKGLLLLTLIYVGSLNKQKIYFKNVWQLKLIKIGIYVGCKELWVHWNEFN